MEEFAGYLDAGREQTFRIGRVPHRGIAVDRALGAHGGDTFRQAPLRRGRFARSGRADHEARYARPPDALAADRAALRQFAALIQTAPPGLPRRAVPGGPGGRLPGIESGL